MQLRKYSKNYTSQSGEDGILEKIFEILPPGSRFCVEFGAWDGKYLSNCYHLIFDKGWRGVMIEADKKKFKKLQHHYKEKPDVILVNQRVDFEGNTLDIILQKTTAPKDIDLLSIDIDGNDYHVWESLKEYAPKVVVVEFNPMIPQDIEFVQERNMEINQGTSLLSMVNLGKTKGYELIAVTTFNAIFVKQEYYGLFEIEDNNISALFHLKYKAPSAFVLYDGTVCLSGNLYDPWRRRVINPLDLQYYPKFFRFFQDTQNPKRKIKVLNFLYLMYRKIKG